MTRIPIGKRTLYELIAEHLDGRRYLVCYTSRKGRTDLWHAVTGDNHEGRRDCLIELTGSDRITFAKPARNGATMGVDGEWSIRFSGRTQRDCQGSELPYVGDLELCKIGGAR